MTDKNKKIFLTLAGVAVLAIAGGVFVLQGNKAPRSPSTSESSATMPGQPVAPAEQPAAIDSDDALEQRAMGDEDADVKIEEYASLTCSHCAHFYNDTFPKLKREYIDTGKVYFVFSDFPLNAPAMHASMISRCVPEDEYFDFVETLFAEQEKWGFDPNYLAYLKAEAAKHGVNGATFQSCLQNSEIQQGIVKRMEASQAQWQINSTPTFVINSKETITGAISYDQLRKEIEEALGNPAPKTVEAPAPAPAATENPAPAPSSTPAATQGSAAPKTIAPGEPNPSVPAAAAPSDASAVPGPETVKSEPAVDNTASEEDAGTAAPAASSSAAQKAPAAGEEAQPVQTSPAAPATKESAAP